MNKILIGLFALNLSSCIPLISGEKSKYSKPTDVLKEDSYQSSAALGPVFVGKLKPVTRKISGHIYCGDGFSQRPANKATVELVNNKKVVRSATTESDGSYAFSATFELDGGYSFAIKSTCGQTNAAVPADLTKDLENQDFWIK
jgi:hypothetical protein